jgi:hypothetical protein
LGLLDPLVLLEQLERILRFKDLLALLEILALKDPLGLRVLIQLYRGLQALLDRLVKLDLRVFRAYRV